MSGAAIGTKVRERTFSLHPTTAQVSAYDSPTSLHSIEPQNTKGVSFGAPKDCTSEILCTQVEKMLRKALDEAQERMKEIQRDRVSRRFDEESVRRARNAWRSAKEMKKRARREVSPARHDEIPVTMATRRSVWMCTCVGA